MDQALDSCPIWLIWISFAASCSFLGPNTIVYLTYNKPAILLMQIPCFFERIPLSMSRAPARLCSLVGPSQPSPVPTTRQQEWITHHFQRVQYCGFIPWVIKIPWVIIIPWVYGCKSPSLSPLAPHVRTLPLLLKTSTLLINGCIFTTLLGSGFAFKPGMHFHPSFTTTAAPYDTEAIPAGWQGPFSEDTLLLEASCSWASCMAILYHDFLTLKFVSLWGLTPS